MCGGVRFIIQESGSGLGTDGEAVSIKIAGDCRAVAEIGLQVKVIVMAEPALIILANNPPAKRDQADDTNEQPRNSFNNGSCVGDWGQECEFQ